MRLSRGALVWLGVVEIAARCRLSQEQVLQLLVADEPACQLDGVLGVFIDANLRDDSFVG